jgi:predicted O-methyltransferase YrrM
MKIVKYIANKFFRGNFQKKQDEIYKKLNLNRKLALKKIKLIINSKLIECDEIQEHWTIFSAISISQKFKINKILEIGTFDGKTSEILSLLFPYVKIDTIDLPLNSDLFRTSYNRNNSFLDFAKKRNERLKKIARIKFFEMNSLLLTNFNKSKYDLIWVDGAHGYPVVTADIINAYRLLKVNGVVMVDDVWINTSKNDPIYKSTASYQTLQSLVDAKLINNFSLFLKRISFINNINIRFFNTQKFIGFFRKIN